LRLLYNYLIKNVTVMNKNDIIEHINKTSNQKINKSNTFISNINKSKPVWWLNINVKKFNNEVNLLLNSNDKIIWIFLPKGFVNDVKSKFKIRTVKNAVDLEISSESNSRYLFDIKSGGTNFNFSPFIKEIINY
jgi:hypothetical protein